MKSLYFNRKTCCYPNGCVISPAQLLNHEFHPWEGGEGKVTGQYVISLVEIARKHLKMRNCTQAVKVLEQAQYYPVNLGEGKLYGTQENNIHYYLGCSHRACGDEQQAYQHFVKASTGRTEPTSPVYYNDQPPEMIFDQGKAREALADDVKAKVIFQTLVNYGMNHLRDEVAIDYFAVSLPDFLVFDDNLDRRNVIHCHYMMALGYLGLTEYTLAKQHFENVLSLDISHLGATLHKTMLPSL